MVMAMPLPTKTQSVLLAFDQGQIEYQEHFEKKEHVLGII
jgi:hypothetical protein